MVSDGARPRARLHPSRGDGWLADRSRRRPTSRSSSRAGSPHFCAPMFVFTAGLRVCFWWQRGRSRAAAGRVPRISRRWLVALELTVMQPGLQLPASRRAIRCSSWCSGCSASHDRAGGAGVDADTGSDGDGPSPTIALHNLLDPINAAGFGAQVWLWNLLHQPGAFRVSGLTFIVGYPLVPWVAVMALGFASGPILRRAPADRQRALDRMGAAGHGRLSRPPRGQRLRRSRAVDARSPPRRLPCCRS